MAAKTEARLAASSAKTVRRPFVVVRPTSGWAAINLAELWKYRDLLLILAGRDIKLRYKQTALGASWAVLQPFLTMVIFSIFFGRLAQVDSEGLPYPIFSYAALVPWNFFVHAMAGGSNSLISNANMVKKIYFPKMTLPISAALGGLVDFVLAFAVLVAMMLYYGYVPTARVIWLPLFLLLTLATSLGAGLWFAALNVRFRDVRYTVPFITQAWMFLTPIAYSSTMLEGPWKTVYGLNPMVGVVEGFRWALLGTGNSPGPGMIFSALTALAFLVSGVYYFRRVEKDFADVI